jgi:hypothetical protein
VNWVLWIIVLGLLVALVTLHLVAVRALEGWGVRPSSAVLAMRAVNVVAAIAVVAFAFWKWVG